MNSGRSWVTIQVKSAERATQAAKAQVSAASGLSNAQFTALYYLGDSPGLNSAELARRCDVTPQAMGEVVARLAANGMVEIKTHSKTRRAISIWLTPQGQDALDHAMKRMELLDQQIVANLGAQNADLLSELLAKLVQAANEFQLPDEPGAR